MLPRKVSRWLSNMRSSRRNAARDDVPSTIISIISRASGPLDREHEPLHRHAGAALKAAFDRRPKLRETFQSLSIIEGLLLSGREQPLADASPWLMERAMLQLEVLADIPSEKRLASLYWHLRRGARRSPHVLTDVVSVEPVDALHEHSPADRRA